MRFLKKLFPRAEVCKKASGQITVFMALCFLVFLGLYLVCLQSVQIQYRKKQAEQAVEAGMFSLLSEFEPHLMEQYDLFCLDTSFGGRTERMDELSSHLWHFVENNAAADGLSLQGTDISSMVRITDGSGAALFRQGVEIMKEKTGLSLAEDWLLQDLFMDGSDENTRRFQEDCESYEGTVRDYKDEDDEEDGEDRSLDSEARQWDGLWNDFTLEKAVPEDYRLSERSVLLENTPSHRELSIGMGLSSGTENQPIQKQWFISYLCEYMKHAQEMLPEARTEGYLDYQLEYIIAGKGSDQENLSNVIGRILLVREGMNYAFLLAHPALREKAELLSLVLAGMTGNEGLIKSLEQLILLGWAYGESLAEVRQLLLGYELAAVKTEEDWQVPLSGLLSALNDPGRYDTQVSIQRGISYESCLRIFLILESGETLSMRALDIMEGEVGRMEGCANLHLDHCVDYLTAQVWIEDLYLERSCGYE